MDRKKLAYKHITQFLTWVFIVFLTAYIASFVFFRWDLTQEKRFTLSPASKVILEKLEGQVLVKVYLEGDIPSGFKKLNQATREMLDEFRIYADENIQYQFVDPYEITDKKKVNAILGELSEKGLQPVNVKIRGEKGSYTEKMVVPGILVSYNGIELPVSILSNNPGLSGEVNLNNSLQDLEYQLIKAIKSISYTKLEKIAFLEGHGELNQYETGDITRELANFYQVDRGAINGNMNALDPYKCIIIAKPRTAFSEEDKFVIDQYIMNGGKVLWFVDAVELSADTIANGTGFATIAPLNIDDQLFRYGFRVNPVLVQDVQCALVPVNSAISGNQAKFVPAPWQYFPLLSGSAYHPVSRNLPMVKAEYCSFIDTLENQSTKKSVLLASSQISKIREIPNFISLQEVKMQAPRETFNKSFLPVAVIAEGTFTSVFKNRPLTNLKLRGNYQFKEKSIKNKILVVADGDIVRNNVKETPQGIMISPVGADKYSSQIFGNKEFLLNAVEYISEDNNLIQLRTREVKLRLLNKTEISENRFFWQMINIFLPVVFVIIMAIVFVGYRKKKYAK